MSENVQALGKMRPGKLQEALRMWHFASDSEGKQITAISVNGMEDRESYVIWLGKTVTSNGRSHVPKGRSGMVLELREPSENGGIAEVWFDEASDPQWVDFKDLEPFEIGVH